jgi:acetolactate synthase-1/2/3 large subunit
MKVCDAIALWLAERGITHSFGIIGGGNVVLWDAIHRLGKTELVCVHHEQAAAMAATYYFRTCGKVALTLVTTGAGSSNAITGILAAYMDSIPLLVLSGNEAHKYMYAYARVWGVQGYASVESAQRYTKLAERMLPKNDYIERLNDALNIALAAPSGPVWFDIPKDLQSADI